MAWDLHTSQPMDLERTDADRTYHSSIVIAAHTREALIAQLNIMLGTTLDLYSQVKQAHWNVKGPHFFSRHRLFDELATRLRRAADDMAERASALGGHTKGTLRLAIACSKLDEYDHRATTGSEHIRALVTRYSRYTGLLREAIDTTQERGDPATADLYIEILRGAERDLWFLESQINV